VKRRSSTPGSAVANTIVTAMSGRSRSRPSNRMAAAASKSRVRLSTPAAIGWSPSATTASSTLSGGLSTVS
jgi:hypothetical protein